MQSISCLISYYESINNLVTLGQEVQFAFYKGYIGMTASKYPASLSFTRDNCFVSN